MRGRPNFPARVSFVRYRGEPLCVILRICYGFRAVSAGEWNFVVPRVKMKADFSDRWIFHRCFLINRYCGFIKDVRDKLMIKYLRILFLKYNYRSMRFRIKLTIRFLTKKISLQILPSQTLSKQIKHSLLYKFLGGQDARG